MVVDEGVVDRLLHALADATRRDILRRCLVGEPSVSRLAEAYPMSFAAVQKHVAVLERAGLVNKERNGREQLVHTDPGAVDARGRHSTSSSRPGVGESSGCRPYLPRRGANMSVTSVDKDYDNLTVTLVAEFDARPIRYGSCGRIRASSSAGGDRRRIRRP